MIRGILAGNYGQGGRTVLRSGGSEVRFSATAGKPQGAVVPYVGPLFDYPSPAGSDIAAWQWTASHGVLIVLLSGFALGLLAARTARHGPAEAGAVVRRGPVPLGEPPSVATQETGVNRTEPPVHA